MGIRIGHADVMLIPLHHKDSGIILEYNVHDPKEETSMEDSVQAAPDQIENVLIGSWL